jgi:hypothetical protein
MIKTILKVTMSYIGIKDGCVVPVALAGKK